MRIIYAVSLELAIKMNEQMILSLQDVAALFENRFSVPMLCNLEKHIFTLNNFKVNVATPLDFALHFCYIHADKLRVNNHNFTMEPEMILNEAVSSMHYAMSQYEISRKKYSSIAVASICHVLQDISEDLHELHAQEGPPQTSEDLPFMRVLRDEFLDDIFDKYA